MNTYDSIREEAQLEQTALFESTRAFFAFSNKQILEGMAKNNIKDQSELCHLFAGLIAPKKNAKAIFEGLKLINHKKNQSIKALKDLDKVIDYELSNYECYYTGDIATAYEVLKDYGVSKERVIEVYNKNKGAK